MNYINKILITGIISLFFIGGVLKAEEIKFSIDINTVDMITSFFTNDVPASGYEEILDRNGDNEFNIFDVDSAIFEFLNPPAPEECFSVGELCGKSENGKDLRCV